MSISFYTKEFARQHRNAIKAEKKTTPSECKIGASAMPKQKIVLSRRSPFAKFAPAWCIPRQIN
jgi:hypothetical protein